MKKGEFLYVVTEWVWIDHQLCSVETKYVFSTFKKAHEQLFEIGIMNSEGRWWDERKEVIMNECYIGSNKRKEEVHYRLSERCTTAYVIDEVQFNVGYNV